MEEQLADLVWRGIEDANPWWRTGEVPKHRRFPFRRFAFRGGMEALEKAERGRGVVVLGPRRVGKSVLVDQVIAELLARGRPRDDICYLAMDDPALRRRDLGELLDLLEARKPAGDRVRVLLLDEIQHAPDWSGWLKRLADRRDPYVFFATGSSATALRRGGQDAGLGRWREMTLFPWSFAEHVQLRGEHERDGVFAAQDEFDAEPADDPDRLARAQRRLSSLTHAETEEHMDRVLRDYFLTGGFPEVAQAAAGEAGLPEARRRLRNDILDRALGRDIADVVRVDSVVLERLFLRICLNPGGLWNETEVARDLGVTRPTVAKYLRLLEQAFLVFRLPNLANPIKGQHKVYLVAPALRPAMLTLDDEAVAEPTEWGRLAENAVVAHLRGAAGGPKEWLGFWRKGRYECDVVAHDPGRLSMLIEVKRGGKNALAGIKAAATALGAPARGYVFARALKFESLAAESPLEICRTMPVALYLYTMLDPRDPAGGTLWEQLARAGSDGLAPDEPPAPAD